MIFRRYGTTYESVALNFDSKALNEIGFRRDRAESIPAADFEAAFTREATREIVAEAEGDVQDHTEQLLLDALEDRIETLRGALEEGRILVVENEQGHDWPKTKQRTSNVIVEGENRLHFDYTVAPPIRISVYCRR
jgi:hypothetical protein